MSELPPPLPPAARRIAGRSALWRESVQEFEDPEVDGPVGLDGWLAFVTVGFVIGIPTLAYHVFHEWSLFTRPGVRQRLTTPGSPAYHPLWGTIMNLEMAGDAVRLLCYVTLAVLFYQRRRLFKPGMVAFQIGSLLYLWLDHFLAQQVLTTGSDRLLALVGRTVSVLIWSLYLLSSRRVQNTFVR